MIYLASIVFGVYLFALTYLINNLIADNVGLLDRGQRKRWVWIHRVSLLIAGAGFCWYGIEGLA